MHVGIQVEVSFPRRMYCQRVGTYPSIQIGRKISLAEVGQPYFNIFFLPRKPIVFSISLPTLRTVVAFGCPVRLILRRLDQFARRSVYHERRRAKIVRQLEENM